MTRIYWAGPPDVNGEKSFRQAQSLAIEAVKIFDVCSKPGCDKRQAQNTTRENCTAVKKTGGSTQRLPTVETPTYGRTNGGPAEEHTVCDPVLLARTRPAGVQYSMTICICLRLPPPPSSPLTRYSASCVRLELKLIVLRPTTREARAHVLAVYTFWS